AFVVTSRPAVTPRCPPTSTLFPYTTLFRSGEGLARAIAAGAATAAARGAAREAAELGEHALRLTPPESDERVERMLRLASYLERSEEHTLNSSTDHLVCRLLLEKKKKKQTI